MNDGCMVRVKISFYKCGGYICSVILDFYEETIY